MTVQTFAEAVQLQTTVMLNIARRLDERGWAVNVHRLNPTAEHDNHLFSYPPAGAQHAAAP